MTQARRSSGGWVAGLAAVCVVALAGAASAADSLLKIFHPLETEWRTVTVSDNGDTVYSVPAASSGRQQDGIAVAVVRSERRDARKRVSGYSLTVMGFNCRRQQFTITEIQDYDAKARPTLFTHVDDDDLKTNPVGKGTIAGEILTEVCATAGDISDTPQRRAKAEPQLSSGTGWLSERGYVVTASHVIAGADRIRLYQEGRPVGEAVVVADDPSNDVAVLKPAFDVSPYVGLRLRGRPAGLGTRIFTLGYPLADTLGVRSVKLATGDITGLTGLGDDNRPDDPRFAQVSLPVQSGNSGGPVIDDAGTVAGMVVAKSNFTEEAEIIQNLNFAIKASYIAPLLEELPRIGRARPVDPADSNRVEAVKSSIFMILVEGSAP